MSIDNSKRSKNFKYKAGSITMLVGVLVIVILVNIVVGVLTDKFNLKLDLTHNKLYEMSDITKKLLKDLDTKVNLYYVTENNHEVREIYDFAKLYTQTSPNVTLSKVDSKKEPAFLKKFVTDTGTINNGSIIVESDKRYTVIDYSSMYDYSYEGFMTQRNGIKLENKLSNAIAYVAADVVPKIYFTTGHNEFSYWEISEFLEGENMSIENINLLSQDIPDDADIVFIAGPRLDFNASEIDKLDDYFDKGGSVYITLDIGTSLPRLTQYLNEWGLNVGSDLIAEEDSSSYIQGNKAFILADIQNEDITVSVISQGINVLAPYCRSIGILSTSTVEAIPLLKTSDKAVTYEIRDGQVSNNISQEGSFNLLVYAKRVSLKDTSKEGKLLLASSSGILGFMEQFGYSSILYEQSYGNREIFVNSLQDILKSKINILNIASKDLSVHMLNMNQTQVIIYALFFAILLPLSVLIWGLVVWFKRRHL